VDLNDAYLLIGPTNGLPDFQGLFDGDSGPLLLRPDSDTITTLVTRSIECLCMCPDCRKWVGGHESGEYELQFCVRSDGQTECDYQYTDGRGAFSAEIVRDLD